MKNFYSAIFLNKVWIVALVVAMAACSQFEAIDPDKATLEQSSEEMASAFGLSPFGNGFENARVPVDLNTSEASTPISTSGITPYIIPGISGSGSQGGNRTCDDVYAAFGIDQDEWSEIVEDTRVDKDGFISGSSGRINAGGSFSSPLTVTTNGTFVSWNITPPAGYCVKYVAAIVKGGDNANVYFYDKISSDTGLASPPNASGKPAELSNLTFCWVFERCVTPPTDCWKDETAWADGHRYVRTGNWATFTSYSGSAKTVTLFAGQTMNAGTVAFSAPVDGMVDITISLASDWRFAIVDENVKIQDYASSPSGNPSPGGFAHKGTASENPFTIKVPVNNVYGVHVDVERSIPCKN